MKTYGNVPKTLIKACERNADKVEQVGNEGSDGYWIYLRAGFWNPEEETVAIHEFTVSDCLDKLRAVEPDPRPENKR